MKRILIAITASALMASAASAAFDVTVDVDDTSYTPGSDTVAVNVTLTTQGDHDMPAFQTFEYQAQWDSSFFQVQGSDPGNGDFGTASQTLFPELDGSTTPACFNDSESCVTLSQLNDGNGVFETVTVNGVVTATLLLDVLGSAVPGTALSDVLTIDISSGSQTADSLTVGGNFPVATIVPEPTTAALIGLGLIGLGVAGRRR